MRSILALLIGTACLLPGCGGEGSTDETESPEASSGPLTEFGTGEAKGSYPVATVQSRDIPGSSSILVRVEAKPTRAISGSYSVRCYAESGSDIRSQEYRLQGKAPVESHAEPTLPNADYCQADGQVTFDAPGYHETLPGRITLTVLAD